VDEAFNTFFGADNFDVDKENFSIGYKLFDGIQQNTCDMLHTNSTHLY
jgi:hypothetical protein